MTSLLVTHILYLSEKDGRLPLSGAENHLWVLLPGQVRQGHRVVLLAVLCGGGRFAVTRRKLDELDAAGVEVQTIAEPALPGWVGTRAARAWTAVRLWRRLRGLRRGIVHHHLDIVHAPFVAWLAGCRHSVLTLHNDYPWLQERAALWFRILGGAVREFIAISDRVRDHLLAVSGFPAERVTTIRYGVPAPEDARLTREDLRLPRDVYVVGFVGRLTEQKNLEALVDAVHGTPDVLLVLAGGGPDASRIEARLRARGQVNVRLLGPVPDASRLMPAFDVLCLVSKWEGLGLVLIEAMQRGVPIIGSRRGAIPEILGNGSRGLLCDPDPASIASAIEAARNDPAAMRARAETARRAAGRLFSVDRMLAETQLAYLRASSPGRAAWAMEQTP